MRTNPLVKARNLGNLTAAMVAFGCLWCAGCGNETPAANGEPASGPPSSSSSTPPAAAQAPAPEAPIAWWVPQNWERVPGEKPMRVATFRRGVANEEIVVSQFPGDVGGVLANVNRWRQQVGLPPITEAELPTQIRPFDNGKLKGHTMRLRGEHQHMLAAIIGDPDANRTWFVKAVTTPMAADTLEVNLYAFAGSFGTGEFPSELAPSATQPSQK